MKIFIAIFIFSQTRPKRYSWNRSRESPGAFFPSENFHFFLKVLIIAFSFNSKRLHGTLRNIRSTVKQRHKQHIMITSKSTKALVLVVAILSVATAFNNRATNIGTLSVFDAHTARPSSRRASTGMYGSRVQSLSSSLSSSQRKRRHTSIGSRLQFSDNSSPDTTIEASWWRRLFGSTLASPKAISSSSPDATSIDQEQENVDAYLEFLDKRYRRIHSDDEKETKVQSNAKSFSAMDWLTSKNTEADSLTLEEQQQQDALYVLGVAGLASQKLLQKHHLLATNQAKLTSSDSSAAMEKVVELKDLIDDAIEVNDPSKSLKTMINHAVVNSILLPVLRVIYVAQRQKQLFANMVQRGLMQLVTKATDGLKHTLSQGPRSVLNAVLTIIGGKQNIMRTMAVGYAALVLFRPLLRIAFADGPGIPMIE